MEEAVMEAIEKIRLVETNRINRKGYYDSQITGYSRKRHKNKPLLIIHFKVIKGKCEGFKLSTGFYYQEMKGRVRLTHLCNAVGITGELETPEQLIDRKVRLRVVPKLAQINGRTYQNHHITRFHNLT
jgi:hypothetical protein